MDFRDALLVVVDEAQPSPVGAVTTSAALEKARRGKEHLAQYTPQFTLRDHTRMLNKELHDFRGNLRTKFTGPNAHFFDTHPQQCTGCDRHDAWIMLSQPASFGLIGGGPPHH